MENQIVGTCPRVGQCKNNSPKGWMGGELNGQYENNSTKVENQIVGTKITRLRDGWHENNSQKTGELNGRHENNFPKGWMAQK